MLPLHALPALAASWWIGLDGSATIRQRLMRRAFWQEAPVSWDDQWDALLAEYVPSPLGHCTLPTVDDMLHAVVRSPASAPDLDKLPYAAYRAAPIAARVLTQRLHDYINLQAPAPVQALVFIPKADAGPYADNFRPLGLPNTADRIIGQAVYVKSQDVCCP